MILQNCEIIASLSFYLITKTLCYLALQYIISMYSRKFTKPLSCIPENIEEENTTVERKKWVPKKKHEALKAKYKCLKKLFQVYDASVIGMLPDPYSESEKNVEEKPKHSKRKKRSHLTKTDACSGTSEICIGDVTTCVTSQNETVAANVIRDLAHPSSQLIDSSNLNVPSNCTECCRCATMKIPARNKRRKLTRFQSLVHRIFGIRQDNYKCFFPCDAPQERRRRGLRVKRVRRTKNFRTEIVRDDSSPVSRVQSVQKSYLNDTTVRQCPFKNCNRLFYGIINYNDHINLCHSTDRKHICHYCHEGFFNEYDKYVHESEHLGMIRFTNTTPSTSQNVIKKGSLTQTEPVVSDEKLKKIVSFIEKISDNEHIVKEMENGRLSESDLQTKVLKTKYNSESGKRTVSCLNVKLKRTPSVSEATNSSRSEKSSVRCQLCGENYAYRRQLSMHMDLDHRVSDKYSKFHSCAGLVNIPRHVEMVSEDGLINVESNSQYTRKASSSTITENQSVGQTLSYDPSTNIIYSSIESLKPKKGFVKKIRAIKYNWEPGTKVIHV